MSSAAAPAPICRIIAGPNAGKTTFALKYLPEVAPGTAFVNPDLIAAGLSPLAPEQQHRAAARLFLQQIELHIDERRDFAFETTLAGRGYLRLVSRLKAAAWRVELIYLALPNVEMSRLRVAERVAHGGHSIPSNDIARRFPRRLRNLLDVYASAVDEVTCFLNSSPSPEIVFVQEGGDRAILQPAIYNQLAKAAMS